MKLPKDRDGFSGRGNKDARFIDGLSDVPFLTRRRPALAGQPGITAKKKNGFLEVHLTPVDEDGFYSIGTVDGEERVVGSATGRGRFTDRGTFLTDDGFVSTSQIRAYGRGLGSANASVLQGTINDFDGKPLPGFDVTVYRTRNGRRFVPHYVFTFFAPFFGGAFTVPLGGEIYGPAGARRFQNTIACMTLDADEQHIINFIRDDGDSTTLGNTLNVPNQLAAWAIPARLAPGRYVMLTGYHRPTYLGSTVIVGDVPGLTFQFSDDGGETWAVDSSHELFQDFFDTVMPLDAAYNSTFNTAVNAIGLNTAPLSGRYTLAYALIPYCPGVPFPSTLKAKVKLGLIDNAARTLSSTLTLFDGEVNAATAFWSGGCVGVEGGAVIVTRPLSTSYADMPNQNPALLFTPNGIDVATIGPTPQPNYRMGRVSAIGPNTIVAPMYDGAHSLYQSKDHGATWSKRAILSDMAAAPIPTSGVFLLDDFAVLTMLRLDGQPANTMPGTPWAADSRIEAPVL